MVSEIATLKERVEALEGNQEKVVIILGKMDAKLDRIKGRLDKIEQDVSFLVSSAKMVGSPPIV